MDEEIRELNEENKQNDEGEKKGAGDYLFSWKRRFDNFWYHYKFALIIGIIILIFVIFCIAQCSSRIQGDANIGYIGAMEIDTETYEELQLALDEILGEDLNGDEKIHVEFTQFSYMTGVQAENAKAMGKPVNYQSLDTVQTQINLELTAGNIVIWFINPDVYKELNIPGRFMTLEDALGYTPEDSYDLYSVKLGSLPCWDYYGGLHDLPASTIVVVRELQLSEEDNKKVLERYERNLIMFKRLVEFDFGLDEEDIDTNTEE